MSKDPAERAERFFALHHQGGPLLMPNAWDEGSAKILADMGFSALATTSSGMAASLGRSDGSVSREEALEHSRRMAAAVGDVPVSADLEDGFATDPEDVAETIRLALATGLAGASVEDYTCSQSSPIYEMELAIERIRAAAEAAHGSHRRLVLTARAENHVRGVDDLADTIVRLQAFQEAGADVVYAPGLVRLADIRSVVGAVDRPVNVLVRAGSPNVAELAEAGVARISVAGVFARVAYEAFADAARKFLDEGVIGRE